MTDTHLKSMQSSCTSGMGSNGLFPGLASSVITTGPSPSKHTVPWYSQISLSSPPK